MDKPITLETMKELQAETKKRIVVDLDGVIARHPTDGKNYIIRSKPDTELIKLLRQLQKNGHYIIIATARKMRSSNSNVNKTIADCAYETIKWLKKYKVVYNELQFGKSWGHLYLDDLALNFNRDDMIKKLKEILNDS